MPKLSIVIPAKNEEQGLALVLPKLRELYPDDEVIVVDDGSTDGTADLVRGAGARCVSHPYSKGNGAAIKSGARAATGDILVFMDGDGQHDPADIARLLERMEQDSLELVVGARQGLSSQANIARWSANSLYNGIASWMVGQSIDDLTSGFRAVRRRRFLEFLYLLPNGFSYPTTSTMAFFRAGYSVGFVPIAVAKRIGKSHMNLVRDGVRFMLIIFKIGTLYSPLKIYFPAAALVFFLGIGNYAYTFFTAGRFTNMSAVMVMSALLIFLIGLMSEQITNLQYKDSGGTEQD